MGVIAKVVIFVLIMYHNLICAPASFLGTTFPKVHFTFNVEVINVIGPLTTNVFCKARIFLFRSALNIGDVVIKGGGTDRLLLLSIPFSNIYV